MKEIKFCGKRVNNGEWVYGYPWGDDGNGNPDCITNSKGTYRVDPATVGQFTGLKKWSQEIYEGDTLEGSEIGEYGTVLSRWQAVVKWHDDWCMFVAEEAGPGGETIPLYDYDFDRVVSKTDQSLGKLVDSGLLRRVD